MKKHDTTFFERFKRFWIRSYYETKISYQSETPRQRVKDLLLMVFGNIILAFGTAVFIIPHGLVAGGVSGIGLILSNIAQQNGIALNVQTIITLLTWGLFLVGLLLLGLKFSVKTLIATIIYPPLLFLFQMLITKFPWLSPANDQMGILLSGIFSGIFIGVGVGLTFSGGGSTGGVDCLSLAADKYLHIKTSKASFLLDGIIIILGFATTRDLEICLIGIISAVMAAMMIDRVFIGQSTSLLAFVVSPKFQEISDKINEEMERGTTLFFAEGGYTANQTKVVQVTFDRKEYNEIVRIVSDIDPLAFITTTRTHEVKGDGFKKMPAKKQTIEELKSRSSSFSRSRKGIGSEDERQ